MLEKIPGGDVFLELPAGEKEVVSGMDLALTGRPGGAGNRVVGFAVSRELATEGGLTGSGGSGNEKKDTRSLRHTWRFEENGRGCKSSHKAV